MESKVNCGEDPKDLETGIFVIALDESSSMGNRKWRNAVNGIK